MCINHVLISFGVYRFFLLSLNKLIKPTMTWLLDVLINQLKPIQLFNSSQSIVKQHFYFYFNLQRFVLKVVLF